MAGNSCTGDRNEEGYIAYRMFPGTDHPCRPGFLCIADGGAVSNISGASHSVCMLTSRTFFSSWLRAVMAFTSSRGVAAAV